MAVFSWRDQWEGQQGRSGPDTEDTQVHLGGLGTLYSDIPRA